MRFIAALFLLLVTTAPCLPADSSHLSQELTPYANFLKKNRVSPANYIMGLFEDKDVVIIADRGPAEYTQWELIYAITSDLRFREKVGVVLTDKLSTSQQGALDAWLSGGAEDREGLLAALRDYPVEPLGWKYNNLPDYLERLRQLNLTLPDYRPIRIYGADIPWTWEGMTRKAYGKLAVALLPERDYVIAANILARLRELKAGGGTGKALVVLSAKRACRIPAHKDNREPQKSSAMLLAGWLPGRTATVMLHSHSRECVDYPETKGLIRDGRWDAAFRAAGDRPAGFDLAGSPFGSDPAECHRSSCYDAAYANTFDGLLFDRPLSGQRDFAFIKGLYSGEFREEFLRRAAASGMSAERLKAAEQEYDLTLKEIYYDAEKGPERPEFNPVKTYPANFLEPSIEKWLQPD